MQPWNGTTALNVNQCSTRGKDVGFSLELGWENLIEKDIEAIAEDN